MLLTVTAARAGWLQPIRQATMAGRRNFMGRGPPIGGLSG
jgi:hypothetical protein